MAQPYYGSSVHQPLRRTSDSPNEREQRVSGYSGYNSAAAMMSSYSPRPQSSGSSAVMPPSSLSHAMGGSVPATASQAMYAYQTHPYSAPVTSSTFPDQQGTMVHYSGGSSPDDLSPVQGGMATNWVDPNYYQDLQGMRLASATPGPSSSTSDDVRMLRHRIQELEVVNTSSRMRIQELEQALARDQSGSGASGAKVPTSHAFQVSWKNRTDARIRQFCALNRAGNALCAWHETRRERRVYSPRAAPPGMLNCGCTYEQALFEESLARHGVGAYHPGENVRMDPALRNPLLQLLQTRYGYRDGDFERDPVTGAWQENEGPLFWEQRALMGTPRRPRGDST